MQVVVICIFIIGYLLIIFEEQIKVNKSAIALITGAVMWSMLGFYGGFINIDEVFTSGLGEISEILFFLLGAMTIVEIIDAHHGFDMIVGFIAGKRIIPLVVKVTLLTFILAAFLDNLAATVVMLALMRKLIKTRELRLTIAGVIILAANAGGLWSPIGSITTTMLWIKQRISADQAIQSLFLPGIVNISIPCFWVCWKLRKHALLEINVESDQHSRPISVNDQRLMLTTGMICLFLVPVIKLLTHLSPVVGMLFGLGIVWFVSEILHRKQEQKLKNIYSVGYALSKIDTSGILFFLGILLAVGALQFSGILNELAQFLLTHVSSLESVSLLIGLVSALVDNVPLVAASIGMFDIQQFPMDHYLWLLIAYTAGTGGSILIIGSAAGVAVMGLEHMTFGWFLKRFSIPAIVGYFGGAITFILLHR